MDALPTGELSQLINDLLVWVGYGTLVGLLAKAIMPGRDPGGSVTTLAMGITGVIIGCGTWSLWNDGQRITPISWPGLLCGTLGAAVILLFYRLLSGVVWEAWSEPTGLRPPRSHLRRRRYRRADFFED